MKFQIFGQPDTWQGPSPHGEGGLKYPSQDTGLGDAERPSPHGEGGLKFLWPNYNAKGTMSLPTRGGWIEICNVVI